MLHISRGPDGHVQFKLYPKERDASTKCEPLDDRSHTLVPKLRQPGVRRPDEWVERNAALLHSLESSVDDLMTDILANDAEMGCNRAQLRRQLLSYAYVTSSSACGSKR